LLHKENATLKPYGKNKYIFEHSNKQHSILEIVTCRKCDHHHFVDNKCLNCAERIDLSRYKIQEELPKKPISEFFKDKLTIPEIHRRDQSQGYYSKSLLITWEKCPLKAALMVTNQYKHDKKQEHFYLKTGSEVHRFGDEVIDLVEDDFLKNCKTPEEFENYLWSLLPDDISDLYKEFMSGMIKYDTERFRIILEGDYDPLDWKKVETEKYIRNNELRMALTIDRLEQLPGQPGKYRLVEFKRSADLNTILKELSWYTIGAREWCEENNFEIVEWGVVSYGDSRSDKNFIRPPSKQSMRLMEKKIITFTGEMDVAKSNKNLVDKDHFKATLNQFTCVFCNMNCYIEKTFELTHVDEKYLSPWELDRIKGS
jgi:hypothetical protein